MNIDKISKSEPIELPRVPMKWIIWFGSFAAIWFNLFQSCSAVEPPKEIKGPVVNMVLSEDMVFEVNEPVTLQLSAPKEFVLRNNSTGEVFGSVEGKDKSVFPMGWPHETFESLTQSKVKGAWILADGANVHLRIVGSEKLVIGPTPKPEDPSGAIIFMTVALGCVFALIALFISDL